MKICLINLPSPALAEPWSNFPLGLGYVAASMERRGYDVSVWDLCSKGSINPESLVSGLDIPQADIYGLSVTTPQHSIAMVMAGLIKNIYPKALVVAGGPHALVARDSFYGIGTYNTNLVDSVVIEEGEFSFYEAVRHYELYGKIEPAYWNQPIRLLDELPFPARHLFKNFKENALNSTQLLKGNYADGGQTTVISSRGCPNRCSFCIPHHRKVRFRSPENIIAELRHLIDKWDICQFKWQDDTFTLHRKRLLKLCHLIKKQLPQTYHWAQTRVDVFDEEMAGSMWAAGFRILCFGIESFSQKLLNLNNKNIWVDQIEYCLRIAKNYGFKTHGFLIFGMPGEDEKTVKETKAGILRNKKYLDYLNLSTLVPLPGTPLRENPGQFACEIVEEDWQKYWIINHENSDDVLVTTKGVPVKKMRKLKRGMYQFMRDQGFARPEWEKN